MTTGGGIAAFMLGWLVLSVPFGIVVGKCIAHADRIELAAYAKRGDQ